MIGNKLVAIKAGLCFSAFMVSGSLLANQCTFHRVQDSIEKCKVFLTPDIRKRILPVRKIHVYFEESFSDSMSLRFVFKEGTRYLFRDYFLKNSYMSGFCDTSVSFRISKGNQSLILEMDGCIVTIPVINRYKNIRIIRNRKWLDSGIMLNTFIIEYDNITKVYL